MWKKNLLEDLETEEVEFESVGKFLLELKRELREGNKEPVKMAELRRIEQEEKMMEEFVQEFRRATKESRYKGRPLVEEFKRSMNRTIY